MLLWSWYGDITMSNKELFHFHREWLRSGCWDKPGLVGVVAKALWGKFIVLDLLRTLSFSFA